MTERMAPPIVTAEDMAARLAALEAEAPAKPPSEPAPQASPLRQSWRERVALLDYFAVTALGPGTPRAPEPQPYAGTPRPEPVGRSAGGGQSFWQVAYRTAQSLLRPSGPASTEHASQSSGGGAPVDSSRATEATEAQQPSESTRTSGSSEDVREHRELDLFTREDCDVVTTRGGSGWRLRLDVRRATLASLGREGALATLRRSYAVPPAPDDVTHHMARRLLEGHVELRGLTPTELAGILRALDWLSELDLSLPSEHDVRCELDLANVLAPLRAVDTPDFVGRERELLMLEEHLRSPEGGQPLALHGPGGVGKSTLLAHFVLQHVERSETPLLFTYLTLDRGELDVQFPLTLVAEACRQLSLQAPQLVQPLTQVRARIDEVLTAQTRFSHEKSTSHGRSSRDVERHRADEAVLATQFAEVVNAATAGQPILVLLDTFEMAQRKKGSFMGYLGAAIARMQVRMPSLRFVIAGRAPVEGLDVRNVPLAGLDPRQASALLASALRDVPLPPGLVPMVVSKVSGNPLSLRLAADLIRREGDSGLGTSRGRGRLLFELREEQVQGVLYRRILDHVDRSVRPLANPGLVVRQITSDVILQVLAEPCGMRRLTPRKAERLFETLRHEVSLVTEVRPGVLVHRADVRREMLPLLETDDPERVLDIHHRAVDYYAARPDFDDQVEHLYHRLMLGEPSSTLDHHWLDSAGAFLADAWTEYPAVSRVYLAARLGVDADPGDLAAADQIAWVRQATRQAQAQLDAGQPALALRTLRGRELSPPDPTVTRLVVEALAAKGDDVQALVVAEAGIADASERGLGIDAVHLGILAGRVAEDGEATGGPGSGFVVARQHYLDARESARDFGARAEALTAAAGALRVSRRFESLRRNLPRESVAQLPAWPEPDLDRELRVQLVKEVGAVPTQQIASHPGLLRELAAEIGSQLPALLIAAADTVGVDARGQSARDLPSAAQTVLVESATGTRSLPPADPPDDILDAARAAATATAAPTRQATTPAPKSEPTRGVSGDPEPPPPVPPSDDEPAPATSSVYGSNIAEALRTSPGDDELKESLSDYWQREVDRPSYDYDEGTPEEK